MASDLNKLIREMTRKGWDYRIRKNSHVQLVHPGGSFIITSATPGDVRAIRNARAAIRRIERNQGEAS